MSTNRSVLRVAAFIASAGFSACALAGAPQYTIVDLGTLDPSDNLQGLRVSSGGVVVGRTLGVTNQGFMWTEGGGIAGLPNLAGQPFGAANGANDMGQAAGTGAQTFFGSSPLPVIWDNGVVSQLPLPAGQTLGRANDINDSGLAVGSVNGGILEAATMYTTSSASVITTATEGGATMTTAFSVNKDGLIAGIGIDPMNAARNVGLLYDSSEDRMVEVGLLPSTNGAIAFDVSDAGHVVGSSSFNQSSGMPFIWTEAGGTVAIPLPTGTSQGSARGVNSSGMAVGTASSAFAIPFFYDGTDTYIITDLLADTDGWDLVMNTSSSAISISDDGVIVGTGMRDGLVKAYAMFPVSQSCPADVNDSGDVDASDLAIILAGWGQPGVSDITGDGTTDSGDLAVLLAAWGNCPL